MIPRFALAALLLVHSLVLAAPPLEVIPLNHRLAEEMAPLIRPLLGPGDVLVPNRTQLIVQTSPDRLAQIKELLQTLDRSPHRLRITVRQGGSLSREELNAAAGIQGQVPLNQPGQASLRLRGHLNQTDSDEDRSAVQQIQALEGSPAQIQFGQSRPVVVPVITPYGQQAVVSGGYENLTTGFAVVARLAGDGNVMLQVTPWSARPDPFDNRQVRSQQASSELRARIGEWINLGGQSNDQSFQQTELLGHRYSTSNQSDTLLIKVDDLDAGKP